MKFQELLDKVMGGLKPAISVDKISKKFNISVDEVEKLIKIGTKVEMEHTNNEKVARTIATHHIFERKDYYSKLKKVESWYILIDDEFGF